jgi:hypothetical protein
MSSISLNGELLFLGWILFRPAYVFSDTYWIIFGSSLFHFDRSEFHFCWSLWWCSTTQNCETVSYFSAFLCCAFHNSRASKCRSFSAGCMLHGDCYHDFLSCCPFWVHAVASLSRIRDDELWDALARLRYCFVGAALPPNTVAPIVTTKVPLRRARCACRKTCADLCLILDIG